MNAAGPLLEIGAPRGLELIILSGEYMVRGLGSVSSTGKFGGGDLWDGEGRGGAAGVSLGRAADGRGGLRYRVSHK